MGASQRSYDCGAIILNVRAQRADAFLTSYFINQDGTSRFFQYIGSPVSGSKVEPGLESRMRRKPVLLSKAEMALEASGAETPGGLTAL